MRLIFCVVSRVLRGRYFRVIRYFDLLVLIEILATGRGGATCQFQFQVMERGVLTQVLTYNLPLKFAV